MKFKIDKDHFSNGLTVVNSIVGTRAAMPLLMNVLIEAEGETVAFTTTNLDTTIRVRIKASVNTSGHITLPAKKLLEIVSSFTEKDVTVEIIGQDSVKITSGRSVFRIMGIATDSFPKLTAFNSESTFELAQKDLINLINKVDYAQSTDENRFMLNGVFFNFEEAKLSLVATDGRRLAIVSMPISQTGKTGSLILPAKTVKEVRGRLGDSGNVKILFDERLVLFVIEVTEEKGENGFVENIQILSKRVEGAFPNYKQVIPKETGKRITIERAAFADSVRRAKIVTGDKPNESGIKITIGQNQVQVTASSEIGDANEKIDAAYDDTEINIAFNPNFLLDPLEALKDDNIFFEFKDEMSPGVIKTNEDFICVIMPQRVQ
ncbi:MAG: DNA polymerase III subunit beta [Puniceicoccales bacterium]|jgi:DNA polymerase-3 subunit beta|nr:DNA polymerase III subunit beta [Puniceicoccales bacterium]